MPTQRVNTTKLLDSLAAALQVEKGGVRLYTGAMQYIEDSGIRSKLQEFHDQTVRHVEILEGVISGFGGDPALVTPMAHAVMRQTECLARFDEISRAGPAAVLGSIQIAELKDRADWQFIDRLAHELGDSRLIQAAQQVLPQEEAHVAYITQRMSELLRKDIMPMGG
jgi:rubrerythrin